MSAHRHHPSMAWGDYGPWINDAAVLKGMALIGAAVKRRRHELAVSQTRLGLMTGIPQSTISRFENGKPCGLAWSRFARLVGVLGGLDFWPTRPPVDPYWEFGTATQSDPAADRLPKAA